MKISSFLGICFYVLVFCLAFHFANRNIFPLLNLSGVGSNIFSFVGVDFLKISAFVLSVFHVTQAFDNSSLPPHTTSMLAFEGKVAAIFLRDLSVSEKCDRRKLASPRLRA